MAATHPQDFTSRFPSWMACRDDPFRCDLVVPTTIRQPVAKKACKPRPQTSHTSTPRRKIVHRLDSADREPPPIPLKVPRTSVGSPADDLRDESDDSDDYDATPGPRKLLSGDIDVTWKNEMEKTLPLSLPNDLAYAIATIGSGIEVAQSTDMNSGISPPMDDADERAAHPIPSHRNSIHSFSERRSSSPSSDSNSHIDARPSLGSRSDGMCSEETAKPHHGMVSLAVFDATRAMENLSKRLSVGASSSAPASIAYRRRKHVNTGNHTLSTASSFSQLHTDGSNRSSYCSAHSSNPVDSESDASSLAYRVSETEELPFNGLLDRSGTTRSHPHMKDGEDQRFRHINGLNFLRTTRSLDRKLLFGFGATRNRTPDSSSVHSASPGGFSTVSSGLAESELQRISVPRVPRDAKPSTTVGRRQSRISGLWGKFKDYIPAGP